jgi:cell division protease FtsH
MAPSIVFIDEIDAVGARRLGTYDGARERDQTLNQILVELDGFDPNAAVVVVAATNRPDILDPALIRPGRFDRHVTLELPDRAGRAAILGLHGRATKFGPDVDLRALAGLTRGFSGADLANIVNEAAMLAVRAGDPEVTMAALDEAVDRVYLGVASRGMVLSDDERTTVAYHEAGHAVVRLVLPGATPPHKVTIVPRGAALGFCSSVGDRDRVILSRTAMIDEMAGTLGGRVAEQLVFGEPGSGAGSDLRKANEMARRMVCELGMSEALDAQAYAGVNVSQEAARAIEVEVRKLLDEAVVRARTVLTTYRGALDAAVQALVETDSLSSSQLADLVEQSPDDTPVPGRAAGRASRRSSQ